MNSIQAEITQRVLELMAYIHSVTESESEYESLLSQAAMELLDEAVLFDEDCHMDTDTTGNLFDSSDYDDDDGWDDILGWDDWDYAEDELDSVEDDDDDDTEYRQQADGRVL